MPAVFFLPYAGAILVLLLAIVLTTFRKSNLNRTLSIGAAGLSIAYFYFIVITFSSQAAYIDDFNLLDSFHRMLYADLFSDRIKALFEQVNEHRFAFERVLMYIIYLTTGSPSPKIQILIGNLFLMGILGLFFKFFQRSRLPFAYFLPVVLVVFSLLYYENVFWGIAAMQNTPLIFFAMLSAWGLGKKTKNGDLLASVAAILTTFTSGSGTAIWIVGFLILLVQKRHRFLMLWLCLALLFLSFYFTFDYSLHSKDRSGLLSHPVPNFGIFLGFLGSLFSEGFHYGQKDHFTLRTLASVAAGGFVFAIATGWLLKSWFNGAKRDTLVYSFLSGVLLFVMATAALLVISRPTTSSSLNMHDILSSRYLIFSVTTWVSVYLALLFFFKTSPRIARSIFLAFLFVNLTVHLASYYSFLPEVVAQKETLDLDKWYTDERDGSLLSFGEVYGDRLFWNHPTAFKTLVKDLEESHLYQPDKKPESPLLEEIDQLRTSPDRPSSLWSATTTYERFSGFNGRPNALFTLTVTPPDGKTPEPRYFVIQSPEHQFILPALAERASLIESLKTGCFWRNRFYTSFPALKFPEDTYDVYLVTKNGESEGKIEKLKKKMQLSHRF
jgi:hypothetical protein